MKTLILLRHAKSGWDEPSVRDFERALNKRGRRAAQRIGQWLADSGLHIDHVIASPAVRVRQTIDGVEQGAGFALRPEFEARVYLASAATLIDVVHGLDDAHRSVLMVGHNPGLEDLVLLLTRAGGKLRHEAEIKYPTATVAVLDISCNAWAEVDEGVARLKQFVRPRDLDPGLGPDED